ncbi:MAG: hypothetical protein HFI33_05620 [Lachnospiraceae bacterium]|nr:hypothetical protein [Lachnospiraceae bacterium]
MQDWKGSHLWDNQGLPRPLAGEDSLEEALEVQSEFGKQRIPVIVEAQRLTREEIREKLPEIAKELELSIKGKNPSLEQVQEPLALTEELEGWPVQVTWSVMEGGPVCQDGTLNQQNLPSQGALTELTAQLQWEEETLVWPIYVRVLPLKQSPEEAFLESLREAVEKESINSQYESRQPLPQEAAGVALQWNRPMDYRGILVVVLAVVGALMQVLSKRHQEEKRQQKTRSQMEMDYPELVSKLKLYMEAGLTCRAAWMKIAGDYQKREQTGRSECRYVYEEMLKTGFEMQSGVGELNAYERFADRCRVPCYKKLIGLLTQNLRKGNRGLGELLETEMWQAFENRKALARKQGEEAGTKLLLPMIGMLGVVMIIVIAPALMSMQM